MRMGNGEWEMGNGRGQLGATFEMIDVRRADGRLRRGAWCDICAVAMGFGPWAMGFKWGRLAATIVL